MSKMRRGLRLAGVSWRVVVADPVILLVLLVGVLGSFALSAGLFLLLFRRFPEASDLQFPSLLIVLPILWIGNVVSSYCNVVITVMADKRLRGEDPTVTEGMSVATARLGRIISFTALSMAVALVLQVLAERLKLAGWLASRLLGLAWALATTFVLPIIAFEDLPVGEAVRRSAKVFKTQWGETVVAQGSVGIVMTLAMIPVAIVTVLLATIALPVGIALGVLLFGALLVINGALDAVVRTALYRYAIDGVVLGAFTRSDLEGMYAPKRSA